MVASDYDTDFYQWTQHQATALAAGHLSELDLGNLAEEIESLGKRDRRALGSRLEVLVMHLLKWCYQPEGRETGHSWESTILKQRGSIARILKDSPSLRRQVPDMIAEDYQRARRRASNETGLAIEMLPETCPWTAEQVLNETFWPDAA
ncbi:MAG: hypothetical protein ETSY1_03745 [Candidatus Entotheonella factor]|uniref:DUF29 domain-containing protein n=1 Tax=Entotheonella factor TaxID=1429438 RepID=W4LXC5_ENTF1|nr:DUF29 domain-containing protein [Candidatus Entotheonella palauensis]ETX02391.1 MAG: hypothetical protein ETSY1_03745 [Candidatus Entotheonella factor]